MKKPINATERCDLFNQISVSVWDRMVLAHTVGIDLKEVGLTADILVDILQFRKTRLANFDVYAKPGWDEKIYGSDLDVFVETRANQYRWFALQAKILKKNNKYTTFRDTSDGIMQWDKLAHLESISGCKGYYLLYNGRFHFTVSDADICKKIYSQNDLGCSLVEPSVVKTLAAKTTSSGRYINPSFEDIHPDDAQPWRILTCCYHDTEQFKLYNYEQILVSNDGFFPLLELVPLEDIGSIESKTLSPQSTIDNPIVNASLEASWNPSLRIFIYRTTQD